MEYICKKCGITNTAETLEEIVSYKKLCVKCLSISNKESLTRKDPKKKKHKVSGLKRWRKNYLENEKKKAVAREYYENYNSENKKGERK